MQLLSDQDILIGLCVSTAFKLCQHFMELCALSINGSSGPLACYSVGHQCDGPLTE